MVANTVMLAAVLKHADLVSIDSLKKALEQQLPAKIQAVNHKALEEGLKL